MKKLENSLVTDQYLMYLLQNVTGKPTHEILGFFNDLGTQVAQMGVEHMAKARTRGMKKKIFDFFPGTAVSFYLLVEGHITRNGAWDTAKRQFIYSEDEVVKTTSTVKFPEETAYVDQTKLLEAVIEVELLGDAVMPEFDKPDPKSPKMYKKLMEEICQRK